MIRNHNIKVEIIESGRLFNVGVGDRVVRANKPITKKVFEGGAIASLRTTKSMNKRFGEFQIVVHPDFYDADFISDVLPNSMVNIFVDDNLLSVFEKEDTKVVFYNGFIIGRINTR